MVFAAAPALPVGQSSSPPAAAAAARKGPTQASLDPFHKVAAARTAHPLTGHSCCVRSVDGAGKRNLCSSSRVTCARRPSVYSPKELQGPLVHPLRSRLHSSWLGDRKVFLDGHRVFCLRRSQVHRLLSAVAQLGAQNQDQEDSENPQGEGRGGGWLGYLPKFGLPVPSGKSSSSVFTSVLINYSVLMSDWWQFKNSSDKFNILSKLYGAVPRPPTPYQRHLQGLYSRLPPNIFVGRLGSRGGSSGEPSPYSSDSEAESDSGGEGGDDELDDDEVAEGLEAMKQGYQRLEEEQDELREIEERVAGKALKEGGRIRAEEVYGSPERVVLWEQPDGDVDAERKLGEVSSPGFSFSAAGLLFPYHLGASQCLIDHDYITENTPLAGSSAGAIVSAVVAAGVGMHEALTATKELAKDCRANGTAFRLGMVLRNFLDKFLPEDAHLKVNGRIRVAVTQVFRRPRGLLVDKFDSREDLISALITSSFVPGYLAPSPVTWFRDRYCIDGGVSSFMPPTASQQTVRVCAFPASSFGLTGIAISPDLNPEGRATTRQLFRWALEPAEDEVLEMLFEQGYQDALLWVQQESQLAPKMDKVPVQAAELVPGTRSAVIEPQETWR